MPIALLQELGALLVQHCIVANLPLLLAEVVQRFPAILSQVLHLAHDTWLTPDIWFTPGNWLLAPGNWHLTPGTWHLASAL